MDILTFLTEIAKVVGTSGIVAYFVNRRAKKSDNLTIAENKAAAEIVVKKVGGKVDSLHEGIKGSMGELMEVSNKVVREIEQTDDMIETNNHFNEDIYVYVIDDNSDDLVMIKRAFDRVKTILYKLYTDENLLVEKLPDGVHVYIIDNLLRGSGKSGLDILRIILNKNKRNFTIAYVGSDDEQLKGKYEDAGVNRFIVKSIPVEKSLKELVKCVLEGIELVSSRR